MADVTSPFGFPYPESTDLVRDGATDIEALAQGVNGQFLAGFQFAGQRIYTSSGQFVKADPLGTGDIGLRAIRVTVVGGGGGGGGCAGDTNSASSAAAAGGSGGGLAQSFVLASALPSSVTVTRGGGGAGGTAGNNAGTNGGSSSFDAFAAASGGTFGFGSPSAAGPQLRFVTSSAGVGTIGDILGGGGVGEQGIVLNPGGSLGARAGAGGTSVTGRPGGINALATDDSAVGLPGTNGAGGSGAYRRGNAVARAGGAGGLGIIVVEVFV